MNHIYANSSYQTSDFFFCCCCQHLATSFLQRAYDAQWRGPTACVSYCTFFLGLVLATFQTSSRTHYIGVALCIAGCAIFTALHFTLSYNFSCYTKLALDGDLKDIAKTFCMKPVVSSNGERTGEYVPSGKTGFWVAEAYEEDSEIDDSWTEVIGSIGLGTLNHPSCSLQI